MNRSNESYEKVAESWTLRNYLRDSKLRATERYRRRGDTIVESLVRETSKLESVLIPNAFVWRKYLKLLRRIATEHGSTMSLILTESAVDCMDYRNQRGENPAPFERSILKRLENIAIVPDLSLKLPSDEWETLNYPAMGMEDRCSNATVRLANALADAGRQGSIVLLIDCDREAKFELENDRVKFQTVEDLVNKLDDSDSSWSDLFKRCNEDYSRLNAQDKECDALLGLSPEAIQEKLKSGEIQRGRFNVSKDNVNEGYVQTSTETLFIDREHFNRAFHQDMVCVAPLPKSQWGRPVGRRRLVHHRDTTEDAQDAIVDIAPVPSARIISIYQPSRRVFVATMVDKPDADDSAVLVIPMDIRIPKIRLKNRSWQRYVGQRLKVEVIEWEGSYPSGRCIELLGPTGNLETEVKALLIENQVELEPFSSAARDCLPPKNWVVCDEDAESRKDLRKSRRVFSVDPPGCQDIDDTMHAEVLPNGDIEGKLSVFLDFPASHNLFIVVGVHIADVTHFVEHDSALDLEAQARGTTFYLVDRRFDMLPSILSSDLCSLHGGIDRLAVSVIWVFSSDLSHVKSTWFGRTVIHNCAGMSPIRHFCGFSHVSCS